MANRNLRSTLLALALATAISAPALAQSFPSQRIRIVVPFAAGGPADVIARIIVQRLPAHWGSQAIVENLPSGAGNVGTAVVAKAPGDGHTILVTTGSIAINPSLLARVNWDPVRDFAPISMLAASTHVVAVHPSLPAKTINELAELLRANPGKYSFASGGLGTTGQLSFELFKQTIGADVAHVPFGGAGPALASTLGGHKLILSAALPGVAANIKDGSLRGLALTSAKRSAVLPDVPTFVEAGYAGLECHFPVVMLAPAATPASTVDLWHREIVRIFALPEVIEHVSKIGFEPIASSPEQLATWIKAELPRWAKVIRDGKIARIE